MSATGNLIVVAGAGTGKTHKLVQTCLEKLRAGAGIDEMLIVTFTKAAAAELRGRIGKALQVAYAEEPANAHLAQQIALLDRAPISTLHSFCLELVSRHFSELGLAPRLTTLEAAQTAALESEALDALFETYYEAKTDRARAAKKLLLEWFRGEDGEARQIVRRIYAHTQAQPDPKKWFTAQRNLFSEATPALWREAYEREVGNWVVRWRPVIESQPTEKNPARARILALMEKLSLAEIGALYRVKDDSVWPRNFKKVYRDPIKEMFITAELLGGWAVNEQSDPLAEDWDLTRTPSQELLRMAEEFGEAFARLKRERGLVDFNDLEQFSLRLLWDNGMPTTVAEYWRRKLKWIFVDEYQDINLAQDQIIRALAKDEGNRFLVGDVKQSIYGFRQAEPKVFLDYEARWGRDGGGGACEYLVRNWRSHERILDFVNGLFAGIMTRASGGLDYDERARLTFADEPERAHLSAKMDPSPKVEVHVVSADEEEESGDYVDEAQSPLAEMEAAEGEAEIIAEICEDLVAKKRGDYGDIVILMRSPAAEVEAFAKVFSRRGIPFDARRTGFFNCIEILDLTNLLTILDNPLQDIPLLGVLRSPLGCFSLEELAQVRVGMRRGPFWEALLKFAKENPQGKESNFVHLIQKWRNLARQTSLAQRLEFILQESGYEDWVSAQERGGQRRANVRRFVDLARQFDETKGEGLYPFLQYIEEQIKAVGDIAPASVESHGAVRLMSVHQSKGLQFPIVIAAGLRKKFNKRDLSSVFLLDEQFGLCLKARPPGARRQYETLAFWLAKLRLESRMRDEEMRILYVALTRAEKQLILVASPDKKAPERWSAPIPAPNSMLDWIGPWLTTDCPVWLEQEEGAAKDWTWRWHSRLNTPPSRPVTTESTAVDPEMLSQLKARIEWSYPFAASTKQEAKSSATALRRAMADEPELARPVVRRKPGTLRAEEVGQAAHRFLEEARLECFGSLDALRAERDRLRETGILTEAEAEAVDPQKVLGFWNSDFGRELLASPETLRRELIFTAKFTAADLKKVGAPTQADFQGEEFIVVQGAADLVSVREREIWLVDFKTDQTPGARREEYALQLRIYSLALERIYKRPVTRACLHFLETGETAWIRQPGYLPLM